MSTKGFTKASNMVVFDMGLSLEALGLYIKIKYLSTIENFKIRREHVKSISGYGETAFRRVWKELKDKNVLIENKVRNKGKFEYQYSLNDLDSSKNKSSKNNSEEKKTPVDSDGNEPIEGQLSIYDIQANELESKDKNINAIEESTRFTNEQSKELLEASRNDINKVINCYEYSKKQKNVKNLYKYTLWMVKNKVKSIEKNTYQDRSKLKFTDYEQRDYDFDKLENALLYGESYDLPV